MTPSRLVSFGEAMIRMTPPEGIPLETATSFDATIGGAELNVAVAARRQGMPSTWVSTVPAGPLGRLVARHAAASDVETVLRRVNGARLGLYFFERATSPRASHIIYDRHGSAFVREPDPEHSWSDLLSADTFLVVTGITAALGPSPRRVVGEAIEAAASLGSAVAVDLNYRASLWSIDEAFSWLSDHMPRIDVLSAAPSDVDQLGITSENRYQSAVAKFGLSAVIGASKEVKGRTAHITVTAATPEECVTGAAEAEIRDPVGTGDAMFGTFLACLNRMPLQQTVEKSVGAVVTAYGLDGDVLTSDPWTAEEMGAVRR